MRGQRSSASGAQSAASAGTWSPERMSLTWSGSPSAPEEPHERDAAPVGVPDLLAELRRARCHLDRDPAGAQPGRDLVGPFPRVLRAHGDEHRARHGTRRAHQTGAQQARDEPRDADREADARVGVRAVGGERVVAAARADRAELLVADQHRLVDGAGVVVEAARDLQVGDDDAGRPHRRRTDQRTQLGQTLVEQLAAHAVARGECADRVDHALVGPVDRGQRQARAACASSAPASATSSAGHLVRADLVQLVDAAQDGLDVVQTEAAVEPLGDLAVVHQDAHRRARRSPGARRAPQP